LEQDPRTRRYRLGSATVEMAKAVNRTLSGTVVEAAAPFADALRDQVGETVNIEVVSGNNIYLAYLADTPNPISLTIQVGDQVMPHAHAGAKAIVAFSTPEVIENWLTRNLAPLTENTVTDPDKLRKIYEEIRETGIAFDSGEYLKEVYAIGAPIFNHANNPVAAVIIVVPSYRMGKNWNRRFILELKKTANAISSRLHSTRKI
jgi:DNA-binding IclR family transcriptional regulator